VTLELPVVVFGAATPFGGGRARSFECDISHPVRLQRTVEAIEADLGRIHSVVHNAIRGRTRQKERGSLDHRPDAYRERRSLHRAVSRRRKGFGPERPGQSGKHVREK
jgi:NAD(P)-dependent dehydrogenase (short-subunit alcohol dehydrogenase family)